MLIILWKERQVENLKEGPAKQVVGNLKAPKGRVWPLAQQRQGGSAQRPLVSEGLCTAHQLPGAGPPLAVQLGLQSPSCSGKCRGLA